MALHSPARVACCQGQAPRLVGWLWRLSAGIARRLRYTLSRFSTTPARAHYTGQAFPFSPRLNRFLQATNPFAPTEWDCGELVEDELEQLSPEEESALWHYAEGARLTQKQQALAEATLAKIRRMLKLE
jgi:hypothetical protein